jgi:hypothetical protein
MAATNPLGRVVGLTIPRFGLSGRQFTAANCRPRLALPVALSTLLESLQQLALFGLSTPSAELVMPRNMLAKEIESTHTGSVVGVGFVEPLVFPSGLSPGNNGEPDGAGNL